MIRARLAELEALRQNEVGTMAEGLELKLSKKSIREQVGYHKGVCGRVRGVRMPFLWSLRCCDKINCGYFYGV